VTSAHVDAADQKAIPALVQPEITRYDKNMPSELTPWHRLFGLCWIGFFEGTDVEVLTEVDLSIKQQFLDLVIIHKSAEPIGRRLPDGFELVKYNLVTFKSFQESLDEFALAELIGHYVNYRKQSSPSLNELLPESDYKLFAVCARYPKALIEEGGFVKLQDGIYETRILRTYRIRVIVVAELALEEHNAMLLLFSAREKPLVYGQEHYKPHSRELSSVLARLFKAYSEDPEMSDKLKEFARQTIDELLNTLPPERLLKAVPLEERLKGLAAEERVKGLAAEERVKGLAAEERVKGLSADELIAALTPETLDELVRRAKSTSPPKQ